MAAGAGAGSTERSVIWMPLAIAAAFLAPLWATGELGVHSFDEPRSHLRWDEAMGAPPTPYDEPGGPAMLAAQLSAGLLLVLAALATSRRVRRRRSRA